MSKEVGGGGRSDIFLDSAYPCSNQTCVNCGNKNFPPDLFNFNPNSLSTVTFCQLSTVANH